MFTQKRIITHINAFATILVIILLTGCKEPKIDTSSDEQMELSIKKVSKSLPKEKRREFEEAMQIIAFSKIGFSGATSTDQIDTEATERNIKKTLNGKTGDEVINIAALIIKKREAEMFENEQKAIKAQKQKVRDLFAEAEQLSNEEETLSTALQKYEEALSLDVYSEYSKRIQKGIEETKVKLRNYQEKLSYIKNIDIYDFKLSVINTDYDRSIPAVKFKLRNNGNRDLKTIEVTVYLRDADENLIAQKSFYPFLGSNFNFTDKSKPLKAGQTWELEEEKWYTFDEASTGWLESKTTFGITDIEF